MRELFVASPMLLSASGRNAEAAKSEGEIHCVPFAKTERKNPCVSKDPSSNKRLKGQQRAQSSWGAQHKSFVKSVPNLDGKPVQEPNQKHDRGEEMQKLKIGRKHKGKSQDNKRLSQTGADPPPHFVSCGNRKQRQPGVRRAGASPPGAGGAGAHRRGKALPAPR